MTFAVLGAWTLTFAFGEAQTLTFAVLGAWALTCSCFITLNGYLFSCVFLGRDSRMDTFLGENKTLAEFSYGWPGV